MRKRGGQELFSRSEQRIMRQDYEAGYNTVQIAKKRRTRPNVINAAIRRVGGQIRRDPWNKKYRISPFREQRLYTRYRLTFVGMQKFFQKQQGLCFWCKSPLPLDVLLCVVDHDGKTVRGICCPDNICNLMAGQIESKLQKQNWGLLTPFVRRVKKNLARRAK